MNKSNLKSYAPQARRDFIAAITARANLLGVSSSSIASSEVRGNIALIEGREWPAKAAAQRDKLIARIKKDGFAQTVDNIAYTWFNRFAALRYMELHDYLGHGWRMLSNRDGGMPEILSHAADINLSALDQTKARELQLAGNQDNELYKMLLVAQCNDLSRAMPFLFEHIDDETELLLPDHLLRTDALLAKLVAAVPEEDWKQVEVIGWLYQFYISEKKDQVIGKVVKSEDIPAATQLFTPNWIVRYLVQNSIGRLWLAANPTSTLQTQWPYYIAPTEQTPEVQVQLNALIQTRMDEDGGSLNPETITVLDPACGSGHILVEAYDLLKAIYLERGYRLRDIPRLILEKNVFGLDIDDRAAQLAGFSLLMKARADDRRILDAPVRMNVMALQESQGVDAALLAGTVFDAAVVIEGGEAIGNGELFGGNQLGTLDSSGLGPRDLQELINFFQMAKTFGSLLIVPKGLAARLDGLTKLLSQVQASGNFLAQSYATQIHENYLLQAKALSQKYDGVIANPPYMGVKGMPAILKEYCKRYFKDSKTDLCATFIEQTIGSVKPGGFASLITMHAWMFLSTFEQLRKKITHEFSIDTLMHIGSRGFDSISGEVVQTVAFSLQNISSEQRRGIFLKLTDGRSEAEKAVIFNDIAAGNSVGLRYHVASGEFDALPGSPIAYWASDEFRRAFRNNEFLDSDVLFRQGMSTTDPERFERLWFEVSTDLFIKNRDSPFVEVDPKGHWYPFNKGGSRRKWYGNFERVVRYERNGQDLLNLVEAKYPNISDPEFVIKNRKSFFQSAITYASIGVGDFSARFVPDGFAYSVAGPAIFPIGWDRRALLALLCSNSTSHFLRAINPTLGFQIADIGKIPFSKIIRDEAENSAIRFSEEAISIAKADWDEYEISWDFEHLNLASKNRKLTLSLSWNKWSQYQAGNRLRLKEIEESNNALFIAAFKLENELCPEISDSQITLSRADREKDSQRLISYAVGCMMGRYSLDAPGLIYAHAGNIDFDPTRYQTFAADGDGILPITDDLWFDDDAAERVHEFLQAVWGAETLDENMAWLAECLGGKSTETPAETIRRYVAAGFYKVHLQTYKKRPIYWLFSSGKQGAFQALVYLHRYNESTLSRLRAQYVIPLTAKFTARIDLLSADAQRSSSTTERVKLQKQIEVLRKKQAELLIYDEKLRHYADMRIALDLDDGVKANYGKFGDLLAEEKAVTGGSADD
jgi:SAM-dependent methyltransferase